MTTDPLAHGARNQDWNQNRNQDGNKDWEARWRRLGDKSFLKQSQVNSPEKWQDFYDRVSDIWEKLAGIDLTGARKMAAVLASHGIVHPKDAVLEIGCGPGNLSMALAGQGCRVTAMDNSRGMIRVLKEKIRAKGVSGIQPLTADWHSLDPAPDHDLAVAAFFPEAFSPRGILRMEQLARNACVLVLGSGVPAFPLHRQIWESVMDAPYPAPGDHLTCARNFLKQTGRFPEVYHVSLPAVLDIECHRVREYFKAYFGMFGCSGSRTDKIIDQVLGLYTEQGRISLEGQAGAALVCWPVPRAAAGCRSKG